MIDKEKIDDISKLDSAKREKWLAKYIKMEKEKAKKYKLLFRKLKRHLPYFQEYFRTLSRP